MNEDRVREQTATLFKALSSPSRLGILELLAESPARVNDLTVLLGLSQPLVSQHVAVLKAARLVIGRKHGRETLYELLDSHIAHIVEDALEHVREQGEREAGHAGHSVHGGHPDHSDGAREEPVA